ncbi:YigZ family protein [Rarobacter incanus]|uniref:Putative YigZ family protein n=1 Tax=Rarobacter incanus TaxID=153494 RepID=A0A542SQM5_9MICO|nr:YigZ family protein [Rarobacter incanus]TQK76921.1 putative YigZ family protein [Rarobacter incanus]
MNPDVDPSRPLLATIAGPCEHEIDIKKSRFIAHLVPVRTVSEADEAISSLRRQYWDARHHCVAMVIGPHGDLQRSSDDGEPSGTAGVPMLEVLRRRQVTDVVAVVVRYFGGTLLGAGGLVRAYTAAVSEALDRAAVRPRALRRRMTVHAPYAESGKLENLLRTWCDANAAVFLGVDYAQDAALRVAVAVGDEPLLAEFISAATGGQTTAHSGELQVVESSA